MWKKTTSDVQCELDALMGLGIEAAGDNFIPGIEICNLKKTFNNVNAVNGLSMSIYKDQITILLGHNGAGKTTTMHILTGNFSMQLPNLCLLIFISFRHDFSDKWFHKNKQSKY